VAAPALDGRIRDWDRGNLFFQAMVGLASLSGELDALMERYVPGEPAPEGVEPLAVDDPFVLAAVGAVRLKERLDAVLAEAAADVTRPSAETPVDRAPLRALLR